MDLLFDIFSSLIQKLETPLKSGFPVYVMKAMLLAWAAAISSLFIWRPLTFSTILQTPYSSLFFERFLLVSMTQKCPLVRREVFRSTGNNQAPWLRPGCLWSDSRMAPPITEVADARKDYSTALVVFGGTVILIGMFKILKWRIMLLLNIKPALQIFGNIWENKTKVLNV